MTEYKQKIEKMLSNIDTSSEKKPENLIYKNIKQNGVKETIKNIFKENYAEIPEYISEESYDDEVPGSEYKFVVPPSSYSDVDKYWELLKPSFESLGIIQKNSGGCIDTKVMVDGKEQTMRICVVRDASNGERPSIAFTYLNSNQVITINNISQSIDKIGLKIDRTNSHQFGPWIVTDVIK